MRTGERIFQKISTPNMLAGEPPALPKKKGRCTDFVMQRNELLFHRYYFYARLQKLKYELVIERLESEFHITRTTISGLIASNSDAVITLSQESPSIKDLRNKFPHFTWTDN